MHGPRAMQRLIAEIERHGYTVEMGSRHYKVFNRDRVLVMCLPRNQPAMHNVRNQLAMLRRLGVIKRDK